MRSLPRSTSRKKINRIRSKRTGAGRRTAPFLYIYVVDNDVIDNFKKNLNVKVS